MQYGVQKNAFRFFAKKSALEGGVIFLSLKIHEAGIKVKALFLVLLPRS